MSNNLLWREVSAAQNQKEVTINEQQSLMDAALTEIEDFSGAGSFVLSDKQFAQHLVFRFTSLLGEAQSVTIPAVKKYFVVDNRPSVEPVQVIKGTTTYEVPPGIALPFFSSNDANTLVTMTSFTVAPRAFEEYTFKLGQPSASELVVAIAFNKDVVFEANMPDALVLSGVAANAAYSFDVQVNDVSIGSLDFAISATSGVFTTSQTSVTVGDTLKIIASATPDATLADLSFTIIGTIV